MFKKKTVTLFQHYFTDMWFTLKFFAALSKMYLLTWARAPVLNNRAVDGITTHTSQTGNHCSTRPQNLACDPIPNIGTCLRHGSPMMWTPYNQSNLPRDMVSADLRRSPDSTSGNLKLLSHNVGWGQPDHHNASRDCTHLCVCQCIFWLLLRCMWLEFRITLKPQRIYILWSLR